MFNATEILISDFVEKLRAGYHRTYGGLNPDYEDIIAWAGSMALENIANSDALYHNVEHTILVTLVGQEILRGKQIREGGRRHRRLAAFHHFARLPRHRLCQRGVPDGSRSRASIRHRQR